MRNWGASLFVIGIMSLVLSLVGLQFKFMSIFGESQDTVSIIAVVVGAILLAIDTIRNKKQRTENNAEKNVD